MAVGLGAVPVFIRVGDSPEYEVGSFTPDATLDGTTLSIAWKPALAAVLREMADEIEGEPSEPQQPEQLPDEAAEH